MQRRCRLCNAWGINPRFHGLYPGKGQVPYALLTRAPVAISVLLRHAAPRLACVKPVASVHPEPGSNSSWYEFHLFFFLSRRPAARLRVIPDAPRLLLVFLTFQYLKELFLLRLLPRPIFRGESGCKDKHFLPSLPNFPATFFKVFSKTPLCHAGKTGIPSTIPLQAVHVLMPPSESGCKSTPSGNIFQIFQPLFSKKINTATIKRWNTVHYNYDRQYACKQAGDKKGGGPSPPASVLLPVCSPKTLFCIYFHPCIYEYFSIIVFINESS